MRLHEFAPQQREPLFDLPLPPNYAPTLHMLYSPPSLRAEITALAPTRSSAVRWALFKRAWQRWHARQAVKQERARQKMAKAQQAMAQVQQQGAA